MKRQLRNGTFSRTVSLATAVLFTFETFLSAAPLPEVSLVSNAPQKPGWFVNFEVPESLGRIESRYFPENFSAADKVVIHIQDAHAHPEAQRHIEGLLESFLAEGLDLGIAVEGAAGPLRPDMLKVFSEDQMNLKLADYLLDLGELTGVERFALNNQQDVLIHGAEQAELYRRSYQVFEKVKLMEPEIKPVLERYAKEVERLQMALLAKEVHEYVLRSNEWHHHKDASFRYFDLLTTYARGYLKLDFNDTRLQFEWPSFVRLSALQKIHQELNSENAARDFEKISEAFNSSGNNFPENNVENWNFLSEKLANIFSSGKESLFVFDPRYPSVRSLRNLMELLKRTASERGIDLSLYPDFLRKAGALMLRDEIDARVLFQEVEKIEEQLENVMAVSDKQKEVVRIGRHFRILEKMLSLSVTRQEYEVFLNSRENFQPASFAQRFTALDRFLNVKNDYPELPADALDSAEEFYRLSRERDEALLEGALSMKGEAVILVTGGFHSQGVTDLMKERGIPYVVVAPKMTQGGDETLYEKVMLGSHAEISDLSGSLSDALVKMMLSQSSQVYGELHPHHRVEDQTVLILRAVNEVLAALQDQGIPQESVQEEVLEWVRNTGVLDQSDYELKFDSNRAVLALRGAEDRVFRAELRSQAEGPDIDRRRFIFAAGASVLLGSASSVLGQVRTPEISKDILRRLADKDSGWFERWTASRDLREMLEKNGIKGTDAAAILKGVNLGFSQSHAQIKKRYVGQDIQIRIKALSAAQKNGTDLAADEKSQELIKEIIGKYTETLRSESSVHDELVKIARLFLSHENLTVVVDAAQIILKQSFEDFSAHLDDFDKQIYTAFLQGDPGEKHRDQIKLYFEISKRRRSKDLEAARDRLEVILKAIKPGQLQTQKELNLVLEKIEALKKDAEAADKKREEIDSLILAEEEKLSPKSRTAIHEGLRYKLAEAKKDLTTKEKREKARDLENQIQTVETRLRELRTDRQTVVVERVGISEKEKELTVEKIKQQSSLSEQTKNVESVESLAGRLQFAIEGLARPELRDEIDPAAAVWIEQHLPEGADRLKVISAIKAFKDREDFDYERMGFKETKTPRIDFLTEHIAEVLPAIAGELPRYVTRIETFALAVYEQFEIGKLPLVYRAAFVLGVFAGQEFSAVQSALKEIFQDIRFDEHQFSDELTAAEYINMTRRYSESISRETILENMLVRLALNQFVFQIPMTARRALEKENLVNELFKELQKPGSGKILTPVFLTDLHGSTKVGSFVAFVLGIKNYSGITSPEELERRLVEEWKEVNPDQPLKSVDEILAEKRILFVGGSDYVDRGPKPYWGFQFNKWLREKGILKFINGNHDLWKAWNISGLHFRVHDTLREIAASGQFEPEHLDEHIKKIDRFVTKAGWNPEKDKAKFEELELQERAIAAKFVEAVKTLPSGDTLEAIVDVYANEIIDSGTNPNHSLEWWAREWGIHGGWFDTFLDQINEELINDAITRANNRLEEDPEHKSELLTIFSNADDLPEEIQPYVSRWKERLESGKPLFSLIDASLFSQGEDVRKLKVEIERIKKENAEIRTANEKLAAQKRYSEMAPQKKVPSAFEMTAQAAEREMGVLRNAVLTLNGLISGLNLPEPAAEIVTQQNYRSNPAVIETALWDWKNFRLIYTDIYENVYVHGIIPVDTEKFDFAVDYKDPLGREFHGIAAIERIQFDVRNFFEKYDTIPDTPEFRAQVEAELGPAFQVLNEWYSDVLGLLKPESIQGYLKSGGAQKYPFGQGSDFSPREFNGSRGTIHVGHVESAKLRKQKLSYWVGGMEGGLLHGDFEMSEGYSGLGAVVTWFSRDAEGRLRGFARYGYSESVSFYSSKIKEAEKKLKAFQEELGKAQSKEEVLAEEIEALQGKIVSAQSEIAGLKERREALAVAGEKIEDITFHDDLQSADAERIRPYVQGEDLAKYFINRFLEENIETYQDLKNLAAKEKRLERAAYYERREAETRVRLVDFRKNESLRIIEKLAGFSEVSGMNFLTVRQALNQADFNKAHEELSLLFQEKPESASQLFGETLTRTLDTLHDFGRAELRALSAEDSDQDKVFERDSGFLRRGDSSLKIFQAKRKDIEKNDITARSQPALLERLEKTAAADLLFSRRQDRWNHAREKISGKDFRIYGFKEIVESEDDFLFGYYDERENKLFLSSRILNLVLSDGEGAEVFLRRILREILYPAAKIAVIGASGAVGSQIVKTLRSVYPNVVGTAYFQSRYGQPSVNVEEPEELLAFFADYQPDVVIYAAGESWPERAEEKPEKANLLNSAVPEWISSVFDGRLVYLSSDYVFDGAEPPYMPESSASPLNVYGASKREGEIQTLKNPQNAVLRLGVAYGETLPDERNFVKNVVAALEAGTPSEYDNVQIRHPVLTRDVAELVLEIIHSPEGGIFQINGNESLTKYEWARVIAESYFEMYPHRLLENETAEARVRQLVLPGEDSSVIDKPRDARMINSIQPESLREALKTLIPRYSDYEQVLYAQAAQALQVRDGDRLRLILERLENEGVRWVMIENAVSSAWSGWLPDNKYGFNDGDRVFQVLKDSIHFSTENIGLEVGGIQQRTRNVIQTLLINHQTSERGLIFVRPYGEGENRVIEVVGTPFNHGSNAIYYLLMSGYMEGNEMSRELWKFLLPNPSLDEDSSEIVRARLQGGSYSSVYRVTYPDGRTEIEKRADRRRDGGKLEAEALYMQNLQRERDPRAKWFPEVYEVRQESDETVVRMEDVDGGSLTDSVLITKVPDLQFNPFPGMRKSVGEDSLFQAALKVYQKLIPDFYAREQSETPKNFLDHPQYGFPKVEKRWQEAQVSSPVMARLFESPYVKVQKLRLEPGYYPNLPAMLQVLKHLTRAYPSVFTPPYLSQQHGDLHFGNILINRFHYLATGEYAFKLIDPKYMPEGNDPLYDFAKLLHNYYGFYDIALDHHDTYHFDVSFKDGREAVLEEFIEDEASGTLIALGHADQFRSEFAEFLASDENPFSFEAAGNAWKLRLLFTHAMLIAGLFPYHVMPERGEIKNSVLYNVALEEFSRLIDILYQANLTLPFPEIHQAWGQIRAARESGNDEHFREAAANLDAILARPELRSVTADSFEDIKQTTAKLVETLSRGDEIEETPSAFLVLGHPHLPNYLEFARQWKEIQSREGVEVPVVIAGGVGRGTLPLAERMLAHYSAQGRLSGEEHDWLSAALENLKKAKLGGPQPLNEEQLTGLVKETELMKFLLVKEGIPEHAITAEAKPSWDTIENFKFSEQVIEGLVKGRKNPLIAIVSAPYLLTRVESSARKYWAKGLELGWKLAKYKTHEVDLSGASEQEILDLAAYLAGNPKKYAESYPRLFFRNELEMGEDPYFGEPRKFSAGDWDTLRELQSFIENFFEVRGAIYDSERNKLLPARSLEEISASRPELRERKEALAILTDAIVLTEEKLENVTDSDLQEANLVLKSKITELSALSDDQVRNLKWEEFVLNPTAGEYIQQALRARLPQELARVFSEKIRYLSALGRPGSGKGTLLGAFIEQLNRQLPEDKQYKSLVMGDYFRGVAAVISGRMKEFSSDEERRKHEELEKTYWQFAELVPEDDIKRMQEGGLMSSATAIRIVNAVLDLPEYRDAHGIFFDGFPRTLEQQDALDNGEIRIGGKLLKMDLNLIVDVGEEVLIERIRLRAEEAERLGQPKRADDTEEVLRKRLVAYDQSTLPLTEKLRGAENTLAIEGNIPGALPREGILSVRESFWKKLSALLNPSEKEAKEIYTEANKRNLSAQLIKLLAKQDALPETADLIVVFGSKDEEPAREAARLYHAGKASRILVSGRYFFNVPDDGSVEPEARIYERILLEAGVPQEAILVEDQSHHMGENAEFSYRFLEERGLIPETAIFLHTPVMQARGAQTARDFFEQKGAKTVFYDHAYAVPDVLAMPVTEAADFVNVLIGEVAIIDEFSPNTPRAGEIRALRDQLKRIAGAEEGIRHELREQDSEDFALWQAQYETARPVLGLHYEDQRWVAIHMARGIMEALAANASAEALEAARGFLARDLFYFDGSFERSAGLLGARETGVSEGQPGLEISIVENIEDPDTHFLAVAGLLSRKPKGYVYEILLGGSPDEAARLQRLFQEEYAYTGFADRYRIAAASAKDLVRVLQGAAGSIYNEVRSSSDASNLAEFIEGYVVFSSPDRELAARSPLHGAWLIHDDLGAHPGLIAARMDRSVSLASGQLEAELIRELGEIKALRKVISASRGLLAGMNLQLVQQLWDKEIAQRWFYKSA